MGGRKGGGGDRVHLLNVWTLLAVAPGLAFDPYKPLVGSYMQQSFLLRLFHENKRLLVGSQHNNGPQVYG